MSLGPDARTFDEKRKSEYEFFLSILKDLGGQGLRPHQALSVLDNYIEKVRHKTGEDKFYWEGVFGPKFSWEKPDSLPEGTVFCDLGKKEDK